MIRTATLDDLPNLEEIMRRASLHWEDTRDQLLAHPEVMVVQPDQVTCGDVRVIEVDDVVVGFSTITAGWSGQWELDGLFVEPERHRSGHGRALVADVVERAVQARVPRLDVIANPNALGFYQAVGFVIDGSSTTKFGPALSMHFDLPVPA